jgi:phosphoribosylformylglycinamidine synthase subunit PurQ / glutaminase
MQRDKIKICIIRVGGTNRDRDAAACFLSLGVGVDVLHLNDALRMQNLSDYCGLVIPGGFAYGDYVRAGAILGKKLLSNMKEDLRKFAEDQKPILGICNGFQVLVEAGILPGFDFLSDRPAAALAPNKSGHFECRWITLSANAESPCIFTKNIRKPVSFPIAHGEGRFVSSRKALNRLKRDNQIALQYSNANGELAKGRYPCNPNGSTLDIAGVCNRSGTILGLMPHPENAFRARQMPDWISERTSFENGDGFPLFESMTQYIEDSF